MTFRQLFAVILIAMTPATALAETKAELKAKKAEQIRQAVDAAMKTIPVSGDAAQPIRACFADALNLLPTAEVQKLADANYVATANMNTDWQKRFPEINAKALICNDLIQKAVAAANAPAHVTVDQAVDLAMNAHLSPVIIDEAFFRTCFTDAFTMLSDASLQALVQKQFQPSRDMIEQFNADYPDFVAKMTVCQSPDPSWRHVELNLAGQGSTTINPEGSANLGNFAGGVDYDNGALTIAGKAVELPDYKTRLVITINPDGSYDAKADAAP